LIGVKHLFVICAVSTYAAAVSGESKRREVFP
jgi:hypothetical protein